MHRAQGRTQSCGTASALRVSNLRFCGRHGGRDRPAIQRELQRTGLDPIIEDRRRTVQIHIIDVCGFMTRVCEGKLHGPGGFIAGLFKAHAVVGITCRSVAGNLSIDLCATVFRLLQFFEHINPRAFSQYDPRTIQ